MHSITLPPLCCALADRQPRALATRRPAVVGLSSDSENKIVIFFNEISAIMMINSSKISIFNVLNQNFLSSGYDLSSLSYPVDYDAGNVYNGVTGFLLDQFLLMDCWSNDFAEKMWLN